MDDLQKKETELDTLLQELQSEHISLTRIYGQTKKELQDAREELKSLERDFENNADSSEISKKLVEQLRNEVERMKKENEQMQEVEETQRKIIQEKRIVSFMRRNDLFDVLNGRIKMKIP